MASGQQQTTSSRFLVRIIMYYAVLLGGGALLWKLLPHAGALAPMSLDALFGGGPPVAKGMTSAAIDEMLRYDSPVQLGNRMTTQDCEIRGVRGHDDFLLRDIRRDIVCRAEFETAGVLKRFRGNRHVHTEFFGQTRRGDNRGCANHRAERLGLRHGNEDEPRQKFFGKCFREKIIAQHRESLTEMIAKIVLANPTRSVIIESTYGTRFSDASSALPPRPR